MAGHAVEGRIADRNFLHELLDYAWIQIWICILTLCFFALLDIRWAICLTLLAFFAYRIFKVILVHAQNESIDKTRLTLRNLAAFDMLQTGAADDLDQALKQADILAAQSPKSAAGAWSMIAAFVFEITLVGGSAFAGLKLMSTADTWLALITAA